MCGELNAKYVYELDERRMGIILIALGWKVRSGSRWSLRWMWTILSMSERWGGGGGGGGGEGGCGVVIILGQKLSKSSVRSRSIDPRAG